MELPISLDVLAGWAIVTAVVAVTAYIIIQGARIAR